MKKNNLKQLFLAFFTLFLMVPTQDITAQTKTTGAELQLYPTGSLVAIYGDIVLKTHHLLYARAGYNWVRHRDLGVHEDERGGGLGGSVGYQYYFKESHKHWFLGARTGIWFNTLDWKDNIGRPNELTGTSHIIVLQPTAIAGFTCHIGGGCMFSPTLAFGREFNIKTEGAAVGQGLILLAGAQLGYRF